MNTISFMSANYVAREIDYNMAEGWMQGNDATVAHFRPLATYGQRLDEMLSEIKGLGFDSIDIWLAHLHWSWATDEHIQIVKELMTKHGMTVNSLAGGFGSSSQEVARSCEMAVALGTDVLGGNAPLLATDRASLASVLKEHDVRLGIENHPEKNPGELLEKIGDGADGYIGAAIDTGWFGTQDYDAAQATRELKDHILHMHMKDVLAPGAHKTCQFGKGCVPLEKCVIVLKELGYTGPMCVEHEPEHYNPNEECQSSLAMLKAWLA